MKLILSSCDFRNDNAKKTIIDNLSKPIDQCKLLFIPNEKATYEAIHSEKYFLRMQEFGFTRDNIAVFDYYDAQQFINLDLDIIYISGGNTFATLKRIKDCGFDKEIIRYVKSGVLYIGGSAGAHIATQSIEHIAAFDSIPDGMNEFKGLGLFDGILICHYTAERKRLLDDLISNSKYKVYALSDDDSLVINSITDDVIQHYDSLVKENNDPVHDPKPLRDYMDKWDGQVFIDKMKLDKDKSVLEIGVGTGRLAVRVAPLCGQFCGIDISPKTIERAKENLAEYRNVDLICADFLSYKFDRKFDVIYSSLTFMHIEEKQTAINKVAALLKDGGKFVLSIDKNQSEYIDTGTCKIKIYPDNSDAITEYIKAAGLTIINQYDTEFAHIFVAQKDG
jgi:peptidase E/predicted RNA methylase